MPRMMAAAERKGYDASEYVPCVHCVSENCPDLNSHFRRFTKHLLVSFRRWLG